MNEQERRTLGEETIKRVYAGDVVVPPEGYLFTDVMLKQLFADQWNRDATSMRDKRILLLGMIAALGETMTFKIQAKAAIKNGEISDGLMVCLRDPGKRILEPRWQEYAVSAVSPGAGVCLDGELVTMRGCSKDTTG